MTPDLLREYIRIGGGIAYNPPALRACFETRAQAVQFKDLAPHWSVGYIVNVETLRERRNEFCRGCPQRTKDGCLRNLTPETCE